MLEEKIEIGLTFDDVSLIPAYSDVVPSEVDISTHLTKKIKINIPLISAAMDTVTESALAIAIAREGGIGIIHRAMPIKIQASEIDKVKKSESGMIQDPINVGPDDRLSKASLVGGVHFTFKRAFSIEKFIIVWASKSAGAEPKGVTNPFTRIGVLKARPEISKLLVSIW